MWDVDGNFMDEGSTHTSPEEASYFILLYFNYAYNLSAVLFPECSIYPW